MARKAPKETDPVSPSSVRIAKPTAAKAAQAAPPKRPRIGSSISQGYRPSPPPPIAPAPIIAPPPPKPAAKPNPKAAKLDPKLPMTRVRKITVQPIEQEEETGEPTPLKINIEGMDDGKPTRRVKRAPRPPEPEEDENGNPKPPKPISRVAALAARSEARPPMSDEADTTSGARFVRMLNRDNRVTGVTAGFVAERMTEGYRFIEGEPTIPTRTGPSDQVVGMKKIRPRDYPRPENNSIFDAMNIWRAAMLDDLDNVEGLIDPARLKGRDCTALVQRLGRIIENPAELGHVYGEMPRGDIAKSLGFGG